jgi:uncharacterized membrane protein YphA (DoxX/SURF4 family)
VGLEDWGSLLLRLGLAAIFLHGAWFSSRSAEQRGHLVAATAPVFPWQPKLFAYAGIVMAAAAGISVLFGIFPRLGAVLMALFLVPGAMIHFGLMRRASALRDKILAAVGTKPEPALRDAAEELGASAAIGNMTSALKNLALIGPALYLALAGAREPLLIGLGPDCQWHGLLTRLAATAP